MPSQQSIIQTKFQQLITQEITTILTDNHWEGKTIGAVLTKLRASPMTTRRKGWLLNG